jgi:hypothetical protein
MAQEPTKSSAFNPETSLSFVVYQVTNLIPFELWRHPDLIALVLRHESVITLVVAAILLAVAVGLAFTLMPSDGSPTDARVRSREQRVLGALLLLWATAGLIYVFAGGYTFESRKKYVTLMFLAPVVAYATSRAFDAARSGRAQQAVSGALFATIVACAATTWIICSLWILNAKRGEALVQAIAATSANAVHVRFRPDVGQAWPRWHAVASSQHDASWVTELELRRRFGRKIVMVGEEESPDVVIDCAILRDGPRCDVVQP